MFIVPGTLPRPILTKKENKDLRSITIIKRTLQSIFWRNEDTTRIINFIQDMCLRATKVTVLASLAILDYINRAVDTNIAIFNTYLRDPIRKHFHAMFSNNSTDTLTPQFQGWMTMNNIVKPSFDHLNNCFGYMWQSYETNFFTNIKTHAKNRVLKLFRLWALQENHNQKPTKTEYAELRRAVNFAFDAKCKSRRNADMIQRLMNYLPDNNTEDLDSTERGFMRPLTYKNSWFRMVPVFIKIQRDIDTYHTQCRQNDQPIRLGNFDVVPIHNTRMKHIRIDSLALKSIMQKLKIHPTKPSPIKRFQKLNKRVILSDKEFLDQRDEHWFKFLNRKVMRKMERDNKKSFDYQILTDGVAVSISFKSVAPPQPETFDALLVKQSKKYKVFGQRYDNGEYGHAIGLDPGYKLFQAGVIKNLETGEETLLKLTSRKFYNMTRQNVRDRKGAQFTDEFEALAAHDRNTNYNDEVVSPRSQNYQLYIQHRLKFFNRGIALYTTKGYTRLAFDKYVHTQSAMDTVINKMLVERVDKRVLIVIGGTEFPANSPIKKYRRCPGIRKLVKYITKHNWCDVVFADEYNTSQVCGRCQRKFGTTDEEAKRHKRWAWRGHRHRLCSDCVPKDNVISLPDDINTKLSCKSIELKELERARNLYLHPELFVRRRTK